jgi:hypothetical protein
MPLFKNLFYQDGLQLNGALELPIHAVAINLLGKNISVIPSVFFIEGLRLYPKDSIPLQVIFQNFCLTVMKI